MSTDTYRHERLLAALRAEYEARFPASKGAHARATTVLIDGGSHGARAFEPYPFYVREAEGAYITTLEGHRLVDFWQGHYANILGHNPGLIRDALVDSLQHGAGLQTGMFEERETEFARLLAETTGAERVRRTTAGSLARYAPSCWREDTRGGQDHRGGMAPTPWPSKGRSWRQRQRRRFRRRAGHG